MYLDTDMTEQHHSRGAKNAGVWAAVVDIQTAPIGERIIPDVIIQQNVLSMMTDWRSENPFRN